MVTRSPDSENQGKAITNGNVDRFDSDKIAATVSTDNCDIPCLVNDMNHQQSRPALGLKRAMFSVTPVPSHSDTSLESSIDNDNLKDGEGFFAAFERLENAKKELRRLRGELPMEMDHTSSFPKLRRPSLVGKSATYEHCSFSSTGVSNNDEALLPSEEAYDHNIMSPTLEDAIPETNAMNFSSRARVSDVKPGMSNKASELLSFGFKGIDKDGAQSLLQDIGEPPLSDMPDVGRCEYTSSIKTMPNMNDSPSHLNDSRKAAICKPLNFCYQFSKDSNNQVSPRTPTLPKSPLASILSLKRHNSRFTSPNDPFSLLDDDSSPEIISVPEARNGNQAGKIGKKIDTHGFSGFFANGKETSGAVTASPGSAGKNRIPNIEYDERFGGVSHNDQIATSKDSHEIEISQTSVSEGRFPSVIAKDITPSNDAEEWMDEIIRPTAQASTRDNLFEIRSSTNGENNLAFSGITSHDYAGKNVDLTKAPSEQEDQVATGLESKDSEVLCKGSIVEKANINGVYMAGDGEMSEPLKTQGVSIKKPDKKKRGSFKGKRKQPAESTAPSVPALNVWINKKRKVGDAPRLPSNFKEKLPKHNLHAGGTKSEAGPRRSTRIRIKPLEFWRGERLLYGRVDDSTVSVIGVKYVLPTKNPKENAVKVKSFVSNKYKNLLDLASSH